YPLVVGDTDELEAAVPEQRPLDAAAPGIDADPQENDLLAHAGQPFRRTLAGHFDSFNSEWGLHGEPWTPTLKLAFSHLANSSMKSSLKSHRCPGPAFSNGWSR